MALLTYGLNICEEWIRREYKDNMRNRFLSKLWKLHYKKIIYENPSWLGNRKFHLAMRRNLLRKDKKYYSKFGWKVKDNLPYYWIAGG